MRSRSRAATPKRTRGLALCVTSAVVGALFLSACESRTANVIPPAAHAHTSPSSVPSPTPTPIPAAQVTITPADGAAAVDPTAPVSVSVVDGTLSQVWVEGPDGLPVAGAASPDDRSWTTTGSLVPSTQYVVTATALDAAGRRTDYSSAFTTADPAKVLGVKIAPLENEVVGVGMPIVVYFDQPVIDKAAVENAMTVTASQPVIGAWHWYGDEEVHFRPSTYWPVGDQVTLTAALRGVDAGNGVWGMADRTLDFQVGDSHVSTVDAKTHLMTVAVNGEVVRTIPVSTGRDKYPTTSGIHVVLEKEPSVVMDSATVGIPKGNPDYYYETVAWDVRISWSGEFVHSAPWSTTQQGHENVSHGCVNASPADAQWFYNLSRRGDLVIVTGTPRPLLTGNGWTDWNMDWTQWLAGSATGGDAGATAPGSYGPAQTPPLSSPAAG